MNELSSFELTRVQKRVPGHPFNHTVKITKSSLKTKNAHELTPELSSLSSSATIIAKSKAIRGRCGKKR